MSKIWHWYSRPQIKKGLQTGLGYDSRASHHVDPAGAVPAVQPVVSLLSPALSPGVLNDPVRHLLVEQRVLVLPEANNQHSMVNAWRESLLERMWKCFTISAAEELPRVGDTAFVELHCVCVQADRNRTIFEEPLKDGRL